MTRDEFEVWIGESAHIDEAASRLPKGERSIEKWLKLFAVSLLEVAKEEAENEEPEEEESETFSDDLSEDLDSKDDEEESEEEEDTD